MNAELNELITNFLNFLNEEYHSLVKIKVFLLGIPELISNGKINQLEFQNFLEKYELQTASMIYEKNRFKDQIAEKLSTSREEVNFKVLVNLGFHDFEDIGRRVLRISNEITLLLVKISVYLKNFTRMQQEFKRLNHFLSHNDYSPRGESAFTAYNPGRNFYGEA